MAVPTGNERPLLKSKFNFVITPRFEIFFALQALTDEDSRIHLEWKQHTLDRLPPEFYDDFETLGGSPFFFPAICDAMENIENDRTFSDIISYLEQLDIQDYQKSILVGTLHHVEAVESLLEGKTSLQRIVENAPEEEVPWLRYLDLLPYNEEALIVQGMNRIIQEPEVSRTALLKVLGILWEVSFTSRWERMQPLLNRSLEEKKRLFDSLALSEFAEQALIRASVDEKEQEIVCCNGHFRIPFSKLEGAYLVPSLFNDGRIWTFYDGKQGCRAYFPYFDPSLSPGLGAEREESEDAEDLEPSRIFKALGDPTRYTIVTLIAQKGRTSAELAKKLDVSKPTISHHVHQLREAGLINEHLSAGSRLLYLKRDVIEHLSDFMVGQLFGKPHDVSTEYKHR